MSTRTFDFSDLTFGDLLPGDMAFFYDLQRGFVGLVDLDVMYCNLVLAVRREDYYTIVTWMKLWSTRDWPEIVYTVEVLSTSQCHFKVNRVA